MEGKKFVTSIVSNGPDQQMFQLTHLGCKSMVAHHILQRGKPALKMLGSDGGPKAMSVFELCHLLRSMGWKWARQTKGLKPVVKMTDPPGTFFTHLKPSKFYLLCLVKQKQLSDLGLEFMAHGAKERYYKKLLASLAQGRLQTLDEFGIEGDGDIVASTANDAREQAALHDGAVTSNDESANTSDNDDGTVMFDDEPSPVADADDAPSVAADGAPAASDGAEGQAPPRKRQRQAREPLPSHIADVVGPWGVHRVDWIPGAAGPNKGYFQAVCSYHKASKKTGCKKSFPPGGVSQDNVDEVLDALLSARHWLNMSVHFSRKSHHFTFATQMHPVPCEAHVAEHCCWVESKVEYTDQDFDELELEFDYQEEFEAAAATDPAAAASAAPEAAKAPPSQRSPKAAPKKAPKKKAKPKTCASPSHGSSSSTSTSSSSSS